MEKEKITQLKTIFDLSQSEVKVLTFLVQSEGKKYTPNDLSNFLSYDLTTMQRSVKNLHDKDLITRSQINTSPGGYQFYYEANITQLLKTLNETFAKSMQQMRGLVDSMRWDLKDKHDN